MIIFENEGLIPVEAFTTFGINAKPNSTNPIGYFGTGLKYAVAVILRLGGSVRLFRGEEEYVFYTKEIDFRGKEFTTIRMKKRKSWFAGWSYEKLPFTTELGKNWEPWMAVRELESNTRDEDGTSFWLEDKERDAGEFLREFGHVNEHKTVIVIENCPEIEAAYDEMDHIFMSPRKRKLAEVGPVEIYEGPSRYIFYRGLRVTDLETRPSLLTYNFTLGVTLTEDRTSKWPGVDQYRIMEAIQSLTDTDLIHKVMDAKENEHYEAHLPWDQPITPPQTNFIAALGFRASTKAHMPKRLKSYYEDISQEDEVTTTAKVELEMQHIHDLIDHIRHGSALDSRVESAILEAMYDALNEEVPF